MAKSGPETRLLNKMRKAATAKYGSRYKDVNHHGDQYNATGVSDLLACLDGVFVACEVKAPESYMVKGQPSVEKALAEGPTVKQRLFVKAVAEAGGIAGFAATVEGYMDLLALAEEAAEGLI